MTKEQKEIYRFVNRVLDSIVDIHNMRYKHLEKKWYETYDSLTNIEEDEKEKLRDCGYEIEWLYNQEEKCIVGLDGRMIFKVNGARFRKI